jgi:hypothetical protein
VTTFLKKTGTNFFVETGRAKLALHTTVLWEFEVLYNH